MLKLIQRYGGAVLLVVLCLSFPVSVIAFIQGNDASNARAHDAQRFAHSIATERRQTILDSCRGQNQRHRATIRELDRLLTQYEHKARTRGQARQIRASRGFTILLIDRLAPLQNCRRLVHKDTTL